MNFFIYFFIFLFKIIEDALATLRLIVVSNGKKKLGAILQFIVTLIWIVLTGSVLSGLQKDIFKAVAFAFGALFGSYFGSLIEEKLALGTNIYTVQTTEGMVLDLIDAFNKMNLTATWFKTENNTVILRVTAPRKMSNKIISIVKDIDDKSDVLSEKIKVY